MLASGNAVEDACNSFVKILLRAICELWAPGHALTRQAGQEGRGPRRIKKRVNVGQQQRRGARWQAVVDGSVALQSVHKVRTG